MHCICYEIIFMLVFWRHIMNQPKWRITPVQLNCFITHNVSWSSSRSPSNFVINGIGFEACHEINAFPSEFFPPVVIRVAAIHANHASGLVIETFSHIDFMINWTYRIDLRRLSPWPYFRSKLSISCLGRIFANVWKTVLYCAMVRNSLQKAVFADFLLARNRFRTNYKATFLWDSSAYSLNPLYLLSLNPLYLSKYSSYHTTHSTIVLSSICTVFTPGCLFLLKQKLSR